MRKNRGVGVVGIWIDLMVRNNHNRFSSRNAFDTHFHFSA